jgi:hypothetical protein
MRGTRGVDHRYAPRAWSTSWARSSRGGRGPAREPNAVVRGPKGPAQPRGPPLWPTAGSVGLRRSPAEGRWRPGLRGGQLAGRTWPALSCANVSSAPVAAGSRWLAETLAGRGTVHSGANELASGPDCLDECLVVHGRGPPASRTRTLMDRGPRRPGPGPLSGPSGCGPGVPWTNGFGRDRVAGRYGIRTSAVRRGGRRRGSTPPPARWAESSGRGPAPGGVRLPAADLNRRRGLCVVEGGAGLTGHSSKGPERPPSLRPDRLIWPFGGGTFQTGKQSRHRRRSESRGGPLRGRRHDASPFRRRIKADMFGHECPGADQPASHVIESAGQWNQTIGSLASSCRSRASGSVRTKSATCPSSAKRRS